MYNMYIRCSVLYYGIIKRKARRFVHGGLTAVIIKQK